MEKIGYIDEILNHVKSGELGAEDALEIIRKLFADEVKEVN